MQPSHLHAISRYLASRHLALDPAALAGYLERYGLVNSDLAAAESDFYELLERFEERVDEEMPSSVYTRREQRCLLKNALHALASAIEEGRIHGRRDQLDERGCGCLLVHLADVPDIGWTSLRLAEERPLLVEELVWYIRPGETPQTNPILTMLHVWLLFCLD